MEVRAQRAGSVVVLDLEGRFTAAADTARLDELVEQAMQHEPTNVVLNLEKVRFLDCSGIGQLVRLHNRVREAGSLFTLVNIDPRQRQLLKILGLLKVFESAVNREEPVVLRRTTVERVRLTLFGSPRPSAQTARLRARRAAGGAL